MFVVFFYMVHPDVVKLWWLEKLVKCFQQGNSLEVAKSLSRNRKSTWSDVVNIIFREPKVVNGPEILNKYVGESEANIRKLFEEAEEEQAKRGVNSGLHIIIFDELDAICKQRGSSGSSTGVHDTVVNQLLSKIDGVNSLNNVLIIGKFFVHES